MAEVADMVLEQLGLVQATLERIERRLSELDARQTQTGAAVIELGRDHAAIGGIRSGLADVATGRITDHGPAMDRIDAVVARAQLRGA